MSAIVKYEINGGGKFIWFGDLHMDFMKGIESELNLTQIDVAFAPHHGRRTGRIPSTILNKISPKIIVIGEAASEHLEYYSNYNTITQNTAGDVIFDCVESKVHVFTSKPYKADYLDYEFSTLPRSYFENSTFIGNYYIGTLNLSTT